MNSRWLVSQVLATLVGVWTAGAAPANGGFETGDFTGWTVDIPSGISEFPPFTEAAGTAAVVGSWAGSSPVVAPKEGTQFASIATLAGGWFTEPTATYDMGLSQTLALHQGDSLSGWACFYNGDDTPQDSAWVKIFSGSGGGALGNPWQQTSGYNPTPPPGTTPWETVGPWSYWTWIAPADGTYIVKLGMTTQGDNNVASDGFFDGVTVLSSVPEPSMASLLLLGLVTTVGLRARLRR